jgi:cyclic beta-1,2-glucan synthetase
VMPGDVYTQPPYVGRGGWSWYTGSAAWMYRAAIESICGLHVRGERVMLDPCLPPHWSDCTVTLKRDGVEHHFIVCTVAAREALQQAAQRGAQPLAPRHWSVLRGGAESRWYLIVVTAADSYNPQAASPMEVVPPAG